MSNLINVSNALGDDFFNTYSVISGTNSGPEAPLRQRALKLLKEDRDNGYPVTLQLVPDWTNPWDSDAIKLLVDIPELGGMFHLGFVKNAQTVCDRCDYSYARFPQRKICNGCRTSEGLRRIGLAVKISAIMRENPLIEWVGELDEVTGGGPGRCYGGNVVIRGGLPAESRKSHAALLPERIRPFTFSPDLDEREYQSIAA